MTRSLPIFIVLAAVVFGCGLAGWASTPTYVVSEHTEFGDISIGVYDHSGLVSSASLAGGMFLEDGVVANPDARELVVTWTGGACADSPRIEIAGSASDLRIELRPAENHSVRLGFTSCPAVGIFLAVSLSLTAPVVQADVHLSVLP